MVLEFLYVILLLIAFLLLTSGFLFYQGRTDLLVSSTWKALGITILLFFFISVLWIQKFIPYLYLQIGILAAILGVIQLLKRLSPLLPLSWHRMANLARACFTDFFALITFFILFRSRCWQQTPKKFEGHNVPILMIHGYGHDAGAWIHHGPILQQAGFGPLYTIDLGSVEHSIVDYARTVQDKARMIAQEMNTSTLFLIGYSMGGLVATYYTFHLAPENSVCGVITLGTPLAGTKMAEFGIGDCAKEMHYQSSFVSALQMKIKGNTKIPFWHIGSWSETIVRPPSSAWLEGSNSQNIVFDDIGHLSMLYSDRITKCLCDILKKELGA